MRAGAGNELGGAAYLSNGNIIQFGGANPNVGGLFGDVWLSRDGGVSWTEVVVDGAFGGAAGDRRQFGYAVMRAVLRAGRSRSARPRVGRAGWERPGKRVGLGYRPYIKAPI